MSDASQFHITVQLIHAARDGNLVAVGELIARYRPQLLERIRAFLGPEARRFTDSDDLLHELFLDLVKAFDGMAIRDDEAFLNLTAHIARNNLRDLLRRERLRKMNRLATSLDVCDDSNPTLGNVDRAEQIERLEEALAALPEDYQAVIRLRDLEGLPYREIAQRMGRPTEAACHMLHARAISRLARLLGGNAGDGNHRGEA